ncbi:hypothetical protein PENCOP_c001G03108 [Penicillium coprophilum]|uniref:Uncharacterized protein n=1 Tax=Penicillium coprophilum TaxID=36646 RepID=A0A1V6V6R7_9EURO|nr:hypothetical protein PENCOP_c001G03108 [Penicillium coprophilum]
MHEDADTVAALAGLPQVIQAWVSCRGRRIVQVNMVEDIVLDQAILKLEKSIVGLGDGRNLGLSDATTAYLAAEDEGIELHGRYLTLRHRQNQVEARNSSEKEKLDQLLAEGEKFPLFFHRPGLVRGTHAIRVKHRISTEPRAQQDPEAAPSEYYVEVPQAMEVLGPRFELPADAVYSVYPEQGHTATHDSLPHIVFNDPMLPWEAIASWKTERAPLDDADRNRVPWLACLVFSPEELTIAPPEMAGIFAPTSIRTPAPQMESLAVRVPMKDLLKLANGTAHVPFKDIRQATQPDISVIFPPAALFNGLFTAYTEDGEIKPSPSDEPDIPDITRHRFLAHIMRMSTGGMAHADRPEEESTRNFSVLVANRVGPLLGDQASPMIAHVVSLEGLETLKNFPLATTTNSELSPLPRRVALASLYSWSFTCLPPGVLSMEDAFRVLGDNSGMLKPHLPPDTFHPDSVEQRRRMLHRLQDGYTIVRSRIATGEITSALMRGPLTPNVVPALSWNLLSNTGRDLQILDPALGMMDLTFAAAWSLGRNLALADRAYTISLTRVRHQILKTATAEVRQQMLRATARSHDSRLDLVRALESLVDGTVSVSRTTDSRRWKRPEKFQPHLDLSYDAVAPFLHPAMDPAPCEVASSLNPKPEGWTLAAPPPHDEYNEPASPDWMIVLRFILDLYYLVNIPAHYLIPDQSSLPGESLRFFFIDHNWIDALVDGALSLGNHGKADQENLGDNNNNNKQTQADDPARRTIKKAFNRFFNEPLCGKHRPAIPRFGFCLRSAVVAQFPGLKVSAYPSDQQADSGPMLLRHDIIDKDTMLGFFSDQPFKNNSLQGLRFELPGHQQYFSVGHVTTSEIQIKYRRQYTMGRDQDPRRNEPAAEIRWGRHEKGATITDPESKTRKPVFIWGLTPDSNDLRLLLVERLAKDVYDTLRETMAKVSLDCFTLTKSTAALIGFQLLSPSWQVNIGNKPAA